MSNPLASSGKNLAVDLDGTLLRTDLLHETFWRACSVDLPSVLGLIPLLFKGKAAFKHKLAATADIDVANLPYNHTVINFIKKHHSDYDAVALVTGSNHNLAKKISSHLDLFTHVYGSDETVNLVGQTKANFLKSTFGDDGYDYIGNSNADLPAWSFSKIAITVGATKSLKDRCEKVNASAIHLDERSIQAHLISLLHAVRPHQWLKNMLVFLPIFAAHQLSHQGLIYGFLAFLSFCLTASAVYVANDLLDIQHDRVHPRKRHRPFASGKAPITHAGALFSILLVLGLTIALLLNSNFTLIILSYFIITSCYSCYVKKVVIADIFLLSILYTTRIFGGAVATDTAISFWLVTFSFFFFLSLAALKRQAELVDLTNRSINQIDGRGYKISDLSMVSTIALAAGFVSVVIVSLYGSSPKVMLLYSSPLFLGAGSVTLLFWLIYMSFKTHRGQMHDDPIVFATRDRLSWIVLGIIAALLLIGSN